MQNSNNHTIPSINRTLRNFIIPTSKQTTKYTCILISLKTQQINASSTRDQKTIYQIYTRYFGNLNNSMTREMFDDDDDGDGDDGVSCESSRKKNVEKIEL